MIKEEITTDPIPPTIPVIKHSDRTDGLIRVREALFNRLSRVDQSPAINAKTAIKTVSPANDLAAQIRITLLKLKAAAMDVDGTAVDYNILRNSPAYAAYQHEQLTTLQQFNPQQLPSTAAARAFWINLYNALVLDAVINFNIQKSVVTGFAGMLTFFRRAAYIVDGQRVSLEDMEHGILRGNEGNPYVPGAHFVSNDPRLEWALPVDPRLHFALNCSGRSCPPIRAYTPEMLNQQLNLATQGFLNATITVDSKQNTITLPQIFRWFATDFGDRTEIKRFLIQYLPDDTRRQHLLSRDNFKFTYSAYNWHLNNI